MNNRFLALLEKGDSFRKPTSRPKYAAGKSMFGTRSFGQPVRAMSLENPDLKWAGASKEQLAFMRKVYHLCYAKSSKGGKVKTTSEADLEIVDGKFKLRKDAAAAYLKMKAGIQEAIAEQGVDVKVGLTSTYRTSDHQLRLWQKYFPKYYKRTSKSRKAAPGGEHGDQAAIILRDEVRTYIATPGFSNHQLGVAVDLLNLQDGKTLSNTSDTAAKKAWKETWLYAWLKSNAADYGFHPYLKEPWHWNFKPGTAGAKAKNVAFQAFHGGLSVTTTQPEELAGQLVNSMSTTGLLALMQELDQRIHADGFQVASLSYPKPTIVDRAGWGASKFNGTPSSLGTVDRIVLHHSAVSRYKQFGHDTAKWVRMIQADHKTRPAKKSNPNGPKWSDIGYHFLIDNYGKIYQGRPFLAGTTFGPGVKLAMGAHVAGQNTGKIGICLLGCYDDKGCDKRGYDQLSSAARQSLESLITHLCLWNKLGASALRGHQDYEKSRVCPGNLIYNGLPGLIADIENRLATIQSRAKAISEAQGDPTEPIAQVWKVGPLDALRAKRAATEALEAAKKSGLPGLWNGPADAFRHAYWNCLMVRAIGFDQAKTVADTHEGFGGNHPHEKKMDFHNNHKGRLAGLRKGNCLKMVVDMLNKGELLVIPNHVEVANSGGKKAPEKPIPSNAQEVIGAGGKPYTYGGSGYGGYY